MDKDGKCDGHCDSCNVNQRSYCAAQMAFYNQQEIAEIKAILLNSESQIVNPIEKTKESVKSKENGIIEDIA